MEEIRNLVAGNPLYVQMAILFGLAALLSAIVTLVLFGALRATAERTESYTLEAVTKRMRNSFFWVFTLLLVLAFWESFRNTGSDGETGNPWYYSPAIVLVRTMLYITGAIMIMRIVNVISDTIRYRYNADQTHNLQERKILTQLQYIERIVGIIIFIVTAAFILLQFDQVRNIGTGILTSAGISGIIIGFAAQKSIANLLAGFQIAFTQPIRIDDALIVDGEFGRVEEITLTYVTLKIWDQRRLIVPLQKFIDDTFQNWTRSSAQLIGSVFMYVDYTFPVAELRSEVERFLPTQELWDQQVGNVMVTDNNADVMILRILASAADAGQTFNLRCAVREHLIGWIQENYPEHLPKTRLEMQSVPTIADGSESSPAPAG